MCKKHSVRHSNYANSCDGVNRYGYRRLKNTEKAGKVFVLIYTNSATAISEVTCIL